ncbi:caspase [Hirsutella rhossiliensis]
MLHPGSRSGDSHKSDIFRTTVIDHRFQETSPFLAYLSACSTGANEVEGLAEETIHLISACQLAGFRHVVGTLWEVRDEYCVDVATVLYETLRDEGMTDRAIARGLHRAVRELRGRESGNSGGRRNDPDPAVIDGTHNSVDVDDLGVELQDGNLASLKETGEPVVLGSVCPFVKIRRSFTMHGQYGRLSGDREEDPLCLTIGSTVNERLILTDANGFEDILEEFPQPKELRSILFPYRDGLFIGTPKDPEVLHGSTIEAFDKAIDDIMSQWVAGSFLAEFFRDQQLHHWPPFFTLCFVVIQVVLITSLYLCTIASLRREHTWLPWH